MFEIKGFEFINFDSKKENSEGIAHEYKIKDFKKNRNKKLDTLISKQLDYAKEKQFKILPAAKRNLEMKTREKKEYEERVEKAVLDEVKKNRDEARLEGFEIGKKEAIQSSEIELKKILDQKIEELNGYIQGVKNEYENLICSQKEKIYNVVKALTKWVILREVENDGEYVERLLEKLILDINSNSNLILKVDQKIIKKIPEIIKNLEDKFESCKDIRVEKIHIGEDDFEQGIILESENSILDARFEMQLKNLDKLFDQLNPHDDK
ncbi:MAG: FliH/SctL family protein [Bacteriovoracales bacterium]|nr:FliH/SctL family protein [Bacteriovoracales bacterium]